MIDSISVLLFKSLVIATFVVISVILYAYYNFNLNHNLNYWKKLGISGPKPIPLFGNMHSYFMRPQPAVELEWYRKYGKLYGFYLGNNPVLMVAEPELVKQILVKDFHTFRNRRNPQTRDPVTSKNLTEAVDDDWKRIRAIVSPTFTSAKLKKLYSLIKECSDEFMDSLDDYAKNGKEIDLKRACGAYTLDVIAKCAFATNTNTHKDPDNEFVKNVLKVFDFKNWKSFLLFLMPSMLKKNPYIYHNLFGNNNKTFFLDVFRHLLNRRKENKNKKYKDFLQLLIDAEKVDITSYETDDMAANHLNEGKDEIEANIKSLKDSHITNTDKHLTENEILAQCMVFLLAGYETTSTTLFFCLYELALHPEVQQKLYEEIETTFDTKGNIDYDTLLMLPYLDAVISESLRKYPPALRLERKAMDNIVLGDTGIIIPKGMGVEIPVYGIHFDPENFHNPYHYNPERFMPANRSNIKPYTYLPFGTGPRNCVGMRFALLETKLALANIIKRFTLSKTSNPMNLISYKKGRVLLQIEKSVTVGIKRH